MTSGKEQKPEDGIVERVIELAEKKYNCSQIIIKLALEKEGKENPDLVRSVSGLGDGCGLLNETCGLMTGAACMLAWYAGKESGDEAPSEMLLPMLQDLGNWFEEEIQGQFKSTRCRDIAGKMVGTSAGMQICGRLLLRTYAKSNEILEAYGFKQN